MIQKAKVIGQPVNLKSNNKQVHPRRDELQDLLTLGRREMPYKLLRRLLWLKMFTKLPTAERGVE